LKNCILYIALLCCSAATAQDLYRNDTIRISEVLIKGKKSENGPAGFKTTSADSSVLSDFSLGSVSDMISGISPIFIKSYGSGGTATPSFRGTAAGNTQVMWNGIRIDHPMLGQSDLSLLPAGLTDELNVYFGGASMEMSSGAAGGVISLDTKPDWGKRSLVVSPAMGSLGRYSGLFSLKSGSEDFQSVTKAFFNTADNDFRYINSVYGPEPFMEKRKNNEISQTGLLQEFYFRSSKNTLSAKFWYQDTWRNLPGTILSIINGPGEKQHDASLRTVLSFDTKGESADYHVTGAWLKSRLNYLNPVASIDSRNLSDTWILKTSYERKVGEIAHLSIDINESLDAVNSNNYEERILRNTADLKVSAQTEEFRRMSALVLIRETLHNGTLLKPDFSAGFQFRLIDPEDYFIKANVSRSSRIPTLNDMFWNPGGNPDLKNEYAYMYEIDLDMKDEIFSNTQLEYNLSIYKNSIRDMIKWHPGEYSYWTADNISNVSSKGIETSLSVKLRMNRISSVLNAAYSYTRANASDADNSGLNDKQIIYTPVNQANGSLRIKYGNVYSSWRASFTGRRYTSADNSQYLPAFFVNDVSAGVKCNINRTVADVSLNIDNLFDADYQTMAYYPLPGRTWLLKILFQIPN
jgi:iron complex outermembrane receptor protein